MMDRLASYLENLGPFDWAASNCCHFVARWLVAHGQPDFMAGLRPTPTLRAARRVAAERGGIVNIVTQGLGREAIPATVARAGDIVHFHLDGEGFTLGICNGRTTVCIDEHGAALFVPTTSGSCAWRLVP